MGSIFHIESPLMQTLTKFANWIIINLITVVLSIPIITIGAAATAMYDTVGRIDRNEDISVLHSYFCAFRSNFKQATVMWGILLAAGLALLAVLWFYKINDVPYKAYLMGFTYIVAVFWLMVVSWVFPLQAQFANPVKRTLNNAVLGALAYLPRSAAMALVNALPWIMLYNRTKLFLFLLPLWTSVWFSAGTHINIRLLRKVFQQYLEQSEDDGTENGQ